MKRTKVKALNSRTSVSSRDKARVKSRDRAKMTNNVVVTLVLSSRMKVKAKRENRRSYGARDSYPKVKIRELSLSSNGPGQALLLPISSGPVGMEIEKWARKTVRTEFQSFLI